MVMLMKPAMQKPARRSVAVKATANNNAARNAALGLALAGSLVAVQPAKADLVADLVAKSEANKELHDKQRLATSYANLARSRTVTDGTCLFPNNLVGCENVAERGDVKFLTDDLKLECEGVEDGKICPSRAKGSYPSPFGL